MTKAGKQKFKCNHCNSYGTLELSPPYSELEKEQILAALQERASFRGLHRIFGVNYRSVIKWVKKNSAGS
jgi:transposase-like protein